MKRQIVLSTKDVTLRHWCAPDRNLLWKYCNTPEVMRELGGPLDRKKHDELFAWLMKQQEDYGFTFWALEETNSAEFLGFCGLVRVDELDSTVLGAVEIGWRLRADKHGKSYARKAAQEVLRYAFTNPEYHTDGLRVVSRTTLGNTSSWGLMQRLRMKHDPRLDYQPRDGSSPLIVHVLTEADWEKRKAEILA